MSEDLNDDTLEFDVETEPPEEEPSAKDQGSLAGKLLIALLLILIFTQGVLTWKVMTMSSGQVAARRAPGPATQDSVEYESLKRDLMALKKQKEELESVLPGLKYEVSVLIEQAENLKSAVGELKKLKAQKPALKAAVKKPASKPAVPKPAAKPKPETRTVAKKAPPKPAKTWTLHIWSFKSLDNAEKKVQETKAKGAPAFFRHSEVPGKGKWYRVYIGKYRSKENAEQAGVSLKARGIVDYFDPIELN